MAADAVGEGELVEYDINGTASSGGSAAREVELEGSSESELRVEVDDKSVGEIEDMLADRLEPDEPVERASPGSDDGRTCVVVDVLRRYGPHSGHATTPVSFLLYLWGTSTP